MIIKAKLTQEHIDKGIRNSPWGCAIALCLTSYFPGKFAIVSKSIVIILHQLPPCFAIKDNKVAIVQHEIPETSEGRRDMIWPLTSHTVLNGLLDITI